MTSTAVSGRTPLHITNFVGLCLLSALAKKQKKEKTLQLTMLLLPKHESDASPTIDI